jgi:group I intron endonuclease
MRNKTSGIYQIQSKIHPDKIYIGSAVDIDRRWKEHLNSLRIGNHHSHKLQRYYNKYKDSLQFSIIFVCPKETLIENEQKFIDKLNPYFNECKVAGSQLGLKRSEEFKKKMSKKRTEYKTFLGKHHSTEVCNIISKAHSISIIQYDKQGNFIKEWDSATKASEELLISQGNICGCRRGLRKTAGGFIWKQKQTVQ